MGVLTHSCNLNISVAGEKVLEAETSRRTSKEESSQRKMKPSPTWGLMKKCSGLRTAIEKHWMPFLLWASSKGRSMLRRALAVQTEEAMQ